MLEKNMSTFFIPKGFFLYLCELMELATAATVFLSWGHLIFNNIIDLTAPTPLYETVHTIMAS